MELKKYKLGEIADISVGFPFESEKFNTEAKGIRLVRGMNVTERSLRFGDDSRWWSNLADFLTPYYLKKDDIVIGMDGSKVGKNFAIVKEEDLPLLLVQRVACVRAKKDYSQHFLWHYISSSRFMEYVETIKTGSAIPHISGNQIANFPIFVPSLDSQRKIASVLSALDSKIALNRRINTRLEQIAKRLYDYWFVQFDFPNADGKPYKSNGGKMVWNEQLKREIPEGWEVDNICRVSKILSGGTPSKAIADYWNGDIYFFGPTDYNGNMFQLSTKEKITMDGLSHCASSLFERNTIIITARGSVGKLVIVGNPMAMNQSCYALAQKNSNNYEYLYYLTMQLIDNLKVKSSGSVFKSIISSDIESSYLSIGDSATIDLYCKRVRSIFSQIKELSTETAAFTALRDRLLPLLMNGQVEVA